MSMELSSELLSEGPSEAERLTRLLSSLGEDECVHRLARVWDDIGLEETHREGRRESVIKHLKELLTEMVVEEEKLKDKLSTSIQENLDKMKMLARELKVDYKEEVNHISQGTMLHREKCARERVDKLNQLKHDRMKRFKRLTEMEVALCNGVDQKSELSSQWQAQVVPSEEDLQEYRERVDYLSSIKDQRQVEFFNVRQKAQQIWSELEWAPQEGIGIELSKADVANFVFSVENMDKIAQFYKELEDFAVAQEKKAISLRTKIASLWDRLAQPLDQRQKFLEMYGGYNLPTLQALEEELNHLNALKRQNLEKFIKATRVELSEIWDKCQYGPNQRREFDYAFNEDYSDDSLSAHESELDRMRGFYSDNVDLYKLVAKREAMWKQKLDFDSRANDPARLQNRGGKLLAEQKAQTKLMKQFPKVEEQLRTSISLWEESYGRPFIVDDVRYMDKVEEQWSHYKQTKEIEKNIKKRAKEETTLQEMKFGTKPITPAKKRAAASPVSASKVRKVGPSPLVQSTVNMKKPGMKPSRRVNQRRVLADKLNASGVSSGSSTGRNESMSSSDSLASAGDYREFKKGLVQGLPSSKTARSSAIPKATKY